MLFKEQEKTKEHFQKKKKNQGRRRTSSHSRLTHVRL